MSPLLLVVVLLGVGAVALLVFAIGKRRPAAPGRTSAAVRSRRSPRSWRRTAIVLMVLAAVTLGLAFTQFRLQRQRSAAGSAVLAMDVSESMNRTDIRPSRLAAAEEAAKAFLNKAPADLRVGLVTFAGDARILVAPTADRAAVAAALTAPEQGEGTVIGDGLAAALDAIQAGGGEGAGGSASVVLLSDGRDTGSEVSPDEAAARAKDLDVTIYTVVLGRAVTDDPNAGANVDLLSRIAATTGGSTYSPATAADLLQLYRSLGSRLSTEVNITDYGAMLVGLAAILAFAATGVLMLSMRRDY